MYFEKSILDTIKTEITILGNSAMIHGRFFKGEFSFQVGGETRSTYLSVPDACTITPDGLNARVKSEIAKIIYAERGHALADNPALMGD